MLYSGRKRAFQASGAIFRNLVEVVRVLTGGQGVVGSNPAIPTKIPNKTATLRSGRCCLGNT